MSFETGHCNPRAGLRTPRRCHPYTVLMQAAILTSDSHYIIAVLTIRTVSCSGGAAGDGSRVAADKCGAGAGNLAQGSHRADMELARSLRGLTLASMGKV